MVNRHETHVKAVEYAACNLIENGIPTKSGNVRGIDLVLDNKRTISVRGMSDEISSPLMNGSLDLLKSDYIAIVTNLKYNCIRKVYIMTIEDAKRISCDRPYKSDGRSSWFIDPEEYRHYCENYSILTG